MKFFLFLRLELSSATTYSKDFHPAVWSSGKIPALGAS